MWKSIVLVGLLLCSFEISKVDGASGNPFAGSDYYTNPDFIKEVEASAVANPSIATQIRKIESVSAAYWIDTISRIGNITKVLAGASAQQSKTGKKTLTAFVVYDLPNRDCSAAASNGELSCSDSNCAQGLSDYKSKYINPIVSIFKTFPNQPIVAIVEPDSLGNMATNMGVQKCQTAENAYYQGIAYTITQLAALPNVYIYLDAAHGGWLGWNDNREKIGAIFQKVLDMAGGQEKIRGFATNTANYQPLGAMSDNSDPCNLGSQYNNATNEVKYVSLLSQTLAKYGITDKGYIIDTSRNGQTGERHDCSNWCNINNAGLGMRPTSDTASSGLNNIDAYYWIKTPGESDGTSDSSAPRYDYHCGSSDSFKPAPQAGQWNSDYFVMLVKNAKPPV